MQIKLFSNVIFVDSKKENFIYILQEKADISNSSKVYVRPGIGKIIEWFSLPVPKALRNASTFKSTFKYIQAEDSYFKGRDIHKGASNVSPWGYL